MEPIISLVAAPPQTGVQLLFAFLLTLVFQQRFAGITEAQPWTCVVTLLLSVVTAGLLVVSAAVHRVTFQRGLKIETVPLGHRLFLADQVAGRWSAVSLCSRGGGWSYPHARAASSL